MATVLICEDETVIALDLSLTLVDAELDVLGTFATCAAARDAVEGVTPDLAVLDVRLRDGEVFPLAEQLRDMGVGIVFHSGHLQRSDIVADYPEAELCGKPAAPQELLSALQRLRTRSLAMAAG